MNATGFRLMLDQVARSWESQDPALGVELFHEDAIYIEPPDVQLFRGTEQLSAYFGAVSPGTFLRLHHVWFDEESQTGAAEFTFGVEGREEATTGIFVVELVDDLIRTWREYHTRGPADFDAFTSTEGKQWEWHIGNYP